MVVKNINGLITAVQKIYMAAGVNETAAREVAEILVRTTMMGLTSHGVFRTEQYYWGLKTGSIDSNAPIEVAYRNHAVAVVDGNWNFGHLTAKKCAQTAVELAKEYGIGCCTVKNAHHIGALSIYTRLISENNCIALGFCGTNGGGYFVAPHGGKQGRMATNPISFAAPSGGLPASMDFSTSMISEGQLNVLRHAGKKVTPNLAIDHNGNVITDPNDYFGPPRGAILPLGESQGYKGTALCVLNMIFSCLLPGGNWRPRQNDKTTDGNSLMLIAIDISHFNESEYFKSELSEYAEYIRSCEPREGFGAVVFPGDLENAKLKSGEESGVEIDEATYQQLKRLCEEHNINYDFS